MTDTTEERIPAGVEDSVWMAFAKRKDGGVTAVYEAMDEAIPNLSKDTVDAHDYAPDLLEELQKRGFDIVPAEALRSERDRAEAAEQAGYRRGREEAAAFADSTAVWCRGQKGEAWKTGADTADQIARHLRHLPRASASQGSVD